MQHRMRDSGFLPRIESLRGFAALTVAAMHSWQSSWTDVAGKSYAYLATPHAEPWPGPLHSVLQFFGAGLSAVNLFFVISGFVLMLSLLRDPREPWRIVGRFVYARGFRLYPAVFASVALFAALYWATGLYQMTPTAFTPENLLKNALLLSFSVNGVMWSLQSELLAVPLILFGYALNRMLGLWALLALLMVLIVLLFHGPWVRLVSIPFGLLVLPSFAFGMVACVVGAELTRRLPLKAVPVIFILAVAAFYSSRLMFGYVTRWSFVMESAFAAIMITLLAYGAIGRIGTVFDHPLARFYGRISYSFYLLHPLILLPIWKNPEMLSAVVRTGVPHPVIALGLFVVTTAAVTPLAWAMYRWVELPGVTAGRVLIGKARQAYAASPS